MSHFATSQQNSPPAPQEGARRPAGDQLHNVTYLSGFTGDDSYLLVAAKQRRPDQRPALHDAARRGVPRPGTCIRGPGKKSRPRSQTIDKGEGKPRGRRGRFDDARPARTRLAAAAEL